MSVAVFSLVLFKEAFNIRIDRSRKVYHYQGFYFNNSVKVFFLFNIVIDEIQSEIRIIVYAAQSNLKSALHLGLGFEQKSRDKNGRYFCPALSSAGLNLAQWDQWENNTGDYRCHAHARV